MSRPLALTDEQVLEVQKFWRKNNYRGLLTDLANRFEVTVPTIKSALLKTVEEPQKTLTNPQVRGGKKSSKTQGASTEATEGFLSVSEHPVSCLCDICKYHSRGLVCLVGGRRVLLDVVDDEVRVQSA